MKNKKIAVLGGLGYIGSHTIVELINSGYSVISIDNLSNSSEKVIDRIEKITNKRIINYNLDISTSKLDVVFEKNPDIIGIINFAALKSVPESVKYPLKYYKNNINSIFNLLEWINKYNIDNLIFSSSCSVYGNITKDKLPVNENTPFGIAESPYAYTKQIGETIIKDYVNTKTNMNAISLRYFNPVGAHITGHLGEESNERPNNLLPIITQVAGGKLEGFDVFGTDYPTRDGSAIRDYIHVSDIARAHVLALEYLIKEKPKYDVFNLGSGRGYSVLEIIKKFEKITGIQLNYKLSNRRPGDVIEVYSDITKSKEVLNWEAIYNLETIVNSAWKWQQNLDKNG